MIRHKFGQPLWRPLLETSFGDFFWRPLLTPLLDNVKIGFNSILMPSRPVTLWPLVVCRSVKDTAHYLVLAAPNIQITRMVYQDGILINVGSLLTIDRDTNQKFT